MLQAKTADEYFEKTDWKEEMAILRDIMLQTELVECVKWGAPCYTINNKNVVGMVGFKEHFAIWFHQGVFLKDEKGVLVNASEGKTKGLRQWRFTSKEAIDKKAVLEYTLEAIENQYRGFEVKPEKKQVKMPGELAEALLNNVELKLAFNALTPGKRKEFAEYIGEAKQAKTRISRLEKCVPMIMDGIGLNDKYRNC